MLRVSNAQIINAAGHPIRLRGVSVGGWMNLENFINGFPGVEHTLREILADALGPRAARRFFDRLLDSFLTDDDAAFIASCGATVVRLPLNYRHFERDAEPFRYVEDGFARLDRAVRLFASHGLYVILDLHAVQGSQNCDWHSDTSGGEALLWQHPHFQDRCVALWEELARRYAGNPAVAGYDLINEPVSNLGTVQWGRACPPRWDAINTLYRRLVRAIRAIDPDHIIFLEGDTYASHFEGLDEPFAGNLVYSSHNYLQPAIGRGTYPGTSTAGHWDRSVQERAIREHEGTRFTQRHRVPLWVGEFGMICNGPSQELPDRLRALDDQLAILDELGAHWTLWTYKDVGTMGWVTLDPSSPYMRLVAPILEAKRELGIELWMSWEPVTQAREHLDSLVRSVRRIARGRSTPSAADEYYVRRTLLDDCAGSLLQPAYADCFKGKPDDELDHALASFALRNCRINEDLLGVVKKHLPPPHDISA